MSEALTAESLSGPLRSVAERLGMPFVFRLVEHFGGTTVAIPSGSAGKNSIGVCARRWGMNRPQRCAGSLRDGQFTSPTSNRRCWTSATRP